MIRGRHYQSLEQAINPYSDRKMPEGGKPFFMPRGFYAKLKPCFVIGIVRMRSPVAVNTAFAIAGRIGGNAGSPKPVGELLDLIQWTSMGGVCDIFTSGCW